MFTCRSCSILSEGDSRKWYCENCKQRAMRAGKRASDARRKDKKAEYVKRMSQLDHVKQQRREASARYRANNPDKVKAAKKEQRLKDKADNLRKTKRSLEKARYYAKNAERIKNQVSTYAKSNRPLIRERVTKKYKNTDAGARKSVVGHLYRMGLTINDVPEIYIQTRVNSLKIERMIKAKRKNKDEVSG